MLPAALLLAFALNGGTAYLTDQKVRNADKFFGLAKIPDSAGANSFGTIAERLGNAVVRTGKLAFFSTSELSADNGKTSKSWDTLGNWWDGLKAFLNKINDSIAILISKYLKERPLQLICLGGAGLATAGLLSMGPLGVAAAFAMPVIATPLMQAASIFFGGNSQQLAMAQAYRQQTWGSEAMNPLYAGVRKLMNRGNLSDAEVMLGSAEENLNKFMTDPGIMTASLGMFLKNLGGIDGFSDVKYLGNTVFKPAQNMLASLGQWVEDLHPETTEVIAKMKEEQKQTRWAGLTA